MSWFKRLCVILSLVFVCIFACSFFVNDKAIVVNASDENVVEQAESGNIRQQLEDLFFDRVSSKISEQVYLGGFPLGMTIDGKGVTVVGLNEFVASSGKLCCPAVESGIAVGDTILKVDGVSVNSSNNLANLSIKSQGRTLQIEYIHNGEKQTTSIVPALDLNSKQYRLGLWTRDSSSGIGTMTFFKKNLQFASLGHPICDNKGNIVPTSNGGVYYCDINGVNKGVKGCAGELKGHFDINKRIGDIVANNKYGVYGNLIRMPDFDTNLIDVASISEVRPGKAQVMATIDDNIRQCYDIEIVKVVRQRVKDDKGLVVRITDSRLLERTGGIVQGMSGSPIVQNGKLVGAVTHVFVNDPTRGYGVFAQWMLDN